MSSNTAALQAPRSSHFANETETHLTKSSPLKKPTDLAAAYGKDAARHTFTTRSQLNSGAFGGAGDQHARAMAFMRLAPWLALGVGRLWLLAVARAWVLTRVIVRVCEPCVPPLSLKRSPVLFLPVPVKVRALPRRRGPCVLCLTSPPTPSASTSEHARALRIPANCDRRSASP